MNNNSGNKRYKWVDPGGRECTEEEAAQAGWHARYRMVEVDKYGKPARRQMTPEELEDEAQRGWFGY